MAATAETQEPLTIDDLARQVQLPVRTIREYHTMRLLPPPERRGRLGLYGSRHVQRLQLISRLQRRGYSLAGIRDLLGAWESGTDLDTLLGVDESQAALDETPLRLTRAELSQRLPALDPATLSRARQIGLVRSHGEEHFLVRSPALLGLVAGWVSAGVPLDEALDLIQVLADDLDALARKLADLIVDRIWEPVSATSRAAELPDLLRRGRPLVLQGVASTLADRLGAALAERAASASDGGRLLATTRLLTLIGGGAGKTRLALRAAAEMSRGFLASRSAGARRRCSPIVFSPVDRARGVYDRTHPYLVECGPEPAAVARGFGALAQRRAEAVRQSGGRGLEHERPPAPEQIRQLTGVAGGRDRLPDVFDDQVGQRTRQRAEVVGEHLDHVECHVERDAGPDPVGHEAEQRGTPHHEVVLAVPAHQPDLASAAERGGVQRWQPLEQFRPGQPQRRLVQRRRALVRAEQRGEVRAALPRPEQVPYSRQRVTAALQAGDELQALDVPVAVQAQTPPPFGRWQQAHRVVLADRANRQLDSPGEVVDGQRFRCLCRGSHD